MSDPHTSSNGSSSSSSAGPASLGQMSSLSSECTPLKHRYDQCFNRWFEHYLQVTTPTADGALSSSDPPATSSKKRSFWSRSGLSADEGHEEGGSGGGGGGGAGAGESARGPAVGAGVGHDELQRRRKLRDELEDGCGGLFREYKGCVKQALQAKDILPLLTIARQLNPFPLADSDSEPGAVQSGSGSDSSRNSSSSTSSSTMPSQQTNEPNEPFPFPQASREKVREWEKREGW